MEPVSGDIHTALGETIEPLDDWVHLQPSIGEDRKGQIYLPANVEGAQLLRCLVLALGDAVSDLAPGDAVLMLASKGIDLRDGSKLARREHVVARLA
ncbi:MAG: hypothetical protein KDC46_06910 [Thermoleophilia bacterium]|nr:hypothetical protein [Thermoleophilia bacterium]